MPRPDHDRHGLDVDSAASTRPARPDDQAGKLVRNALNPDPKPGAYLDCRRDAWTDPITASSCSRVGHSGQ